MSGPGGAQTTTTTTYLLGHDEQTTTQVSGQQATVVATRYYPTPGGALAVRDATGLSYLATDHLGTPIATVNLDSGALLGEQLRAPYGEARYAVSANTSSGGMHTTVGFTGQREDSSGLTYFNARYFDPSIGRFAAADSVVGADPSLDGYAYTGGHVESAVDPSGHVEDPEIPSGNGGWISGDGRGPAAIGGGGAAAAGLAYVIDEMMAGDDAAATAAAGSAGASSAAGDSAGDVTACEGDSCFDFRGDTYQQSNADGSRTYGELTGNDEGQDPKWEGAKSPCGDCGNAPRDPIDSGAHEPGSTEPAQPTEPPNPTDPATPTQPTNPTDGIKQATDVMNNNVKPDGNPTQAGAIVTQDGATTFTGYSGEPNLPDVNLDLDGHPFNGGCAEVACVTKALDAMQNGEGGWEQGKPSDIYIRQMRFKGPCAGCRSVLSQFASRLGAPVTAYWATADGVPGILTFLP